MRTGTANGNLEMTSQDINCYDSWGWDSEFNGYYDYWVPEDSLKSEIVFADELTDLFPANSDQTPHREGGFYWNIRISTLDEGKRRNPELYPTIMKSIRDDTIRSFRGWAAYGHDIHLTPLAFDEAQHVLQGYARFSGHDETTAHRVAQRAFRFAAGLSPQQLADTDPAIPNPVQWYLIGFDIKDTYEGSPSLGLACVNRTLGVCIRLLSYNFLEDEENEFWGVVNMLPNPRYQQVSIDSHHASQQNLAALALYFHQTEMQPAVLAVFQAVSGKQWQQQSAGFTWSVDIQPISITEQDDKAGCQIEISEWGETIVYESGILRALKDPDYFAFKLRCAYEAIDAIANKLVPASVERFCQNNACDMPDASDNKPLEFAEAHAALYAIARLQPVSQQVDALRAWRTFAIASGFAPDAPPRDHSWQINVASIRPHPINEVRWYQWLSPTSNYQCLACINRDHGIATVIHVHSEQGVA